MAATYSLDKIKTIMRYDPDTGHFIRLIATNNRVKVGEICGFVDIDGYRRIRVGSLQLAHRLAWIYMTGEWPEEEIDHRNRTRDDNRWSNLRPAGRSENSFNMKNGKPNSCGFRGVISTKSNKFEAAISARKERFYLGTFDTPEEAHMVYKEAAIRLHGEFARFE